MRRWKQALVFLAAAISGIGILNMFLTINGFTKIYSLGFELNAKAVVYDGDYDEYAYMDGQLRKNMLFIASMEPDSAVEYGLALDVIKYLHQEAGLKYVLTDLSYAGGELLNVYMQNGDDALLEQILNAAGRAYASTEKAYFYKALYLYNQALPTNGKLRVFGIDAEPEMNGNRELSRLYIRYLLGKVRTRPVSSKIETALYAGQRDLDEYFTNLKHSLEQNEGLYRELLVEQYFSFETAVQNYFYDRTDAELRRQAQTVNFYRIYQQNIRGKYAGFFTDTSFMEGFYSLTDALDGRVMIYDVLYSDTELLSDRPVMIVNNRMMRYFEYYGGFLYQLHEKEYDSPCGAAENPYAFFIIQNKAVNEKNDLYRRRICA